MASVTCPNCNSGNQIPDEARAFRCTTCAADVRYTEQAPIRPPPPGWQPGWYAGAASAAGPSPQAGKAEKPIWKRPWVWVVGIILLLIIGIASAPDPDTGSSGDIATDTRAETGGGGGGGSGGGGAGGESNGDSASAGIADPVSDGQFTFTVTDFNCGKTKIGSGFLAVEAQGKFCIADMTVKNTGDEAATLSASSQYAYIGDRKYEASGEVFAATKEAQAFFLENINPGNSVQGIVAWDVPPTGQLPERLELHDSPFSGGVDVRL